MTFLERAKTHGAHKRPIEPAPKITHDSPMK